MFILIILYPRIKLAIKFLNYVFTELNKSKKYNLCVYYVYIAYHRIFPWHDNFYRVLEARSERRYSTFCVPFLFFPSSWFPFTATDALHACSPAASSVIKARAKHVSSFNPLFWMLRLLPVRERPLRRKSRNCAHAARQRLKLNPANPTVGRARRGLTTSSPTTRCPRFIFYEIHRILLAALPRAARWNGFTTRNSWH